AVGRPLALAMGELNAVLEPVLRCELEARVERQADGLPGLRRRHERPCAPRVAERVDAYSRRAGDSLQVRVERGLDAGLADHLAGLVPLLRECLQLGSGYLTGVAEQLRGERAVRIRSEERRVGK